MKILLFFRKKNLQCNYTRREFHQAISQFDENIQVNEIDFDKQKHLCQYYQVSGIPTIVIEEPSGKRQLFSGMISKKEIIKLIDERVCNP